MAASTDPDLAGWFWHESAISTSRPLPVLKVCSSQLINHTAVQLDVDTETFEALTDAEADLLARIRRLEPRQQEALRVLIELAIERGEPIPEPTEDLILNLGS